MRTRARAPRIPAKLRRAAEHVVNAHRDIDAVLLFGSRARGDDRPDSDYDLAVVGRCPRAAERALLGAHPRVEQVYVVSPEQLQAKANLATALEAAIVRQAVTIAGAWGAPEHRTEGLDVSALELANNLKAAGTRLQAAIESTAKALTRGSLSDADATTNAFDTAERTGKALLWAFGESPKTVHDLATLADQLEHEVQGPSGDAQDRAELAGMLRALNGLGPTGHTTTYAGVQVFEIVEDTADRACKVAQLHSATLRQVAMRHDPTRTEEPSERRALAALHESAQGNLEQAVRVLSEPTPDPLRHAALTWLHAAADATVAFGDALAKIEHPGDPDGQRAAEQASRGDVRRVGGKWLDERPGTEPPRAGPPQRTRTAPTGTARQRLAKAASTATAATRHCLEADANSTESMSSQAWQDLRHEATAFLGGAAYQDDERLDDVATRLIGHTPQTETDYSRAARRLAYRANLAEATLLATRLNERARHARDRTELRVEFETCDDIHTLTTPAADTRTTKERENFLANMGPNLKADNAAHVEHAMNLLPRLDWRMEQIEHRLGMGAREQHTVEDRTCHC